MPCLPPPGSRLFPVTAAYFGNRNGKTHLSSQVVSSESWVNNVNFRNCFTSAAIVVIFTSRGIHAGAIGPVDPYHGWTGGRENRLISEIRGHEDLHYGGVCTRLKGPRFKAFGFLFYMLWQDTSLDGLLNKSRG